MEKQKNAKRGISLIILVITIIVMIILAAAIIISLNNTNVVEKANQAVSATDFKNTQTIASVAWSEAYNNGARTADKLSKAVNSALKENNVDLSKYFVDVTVSGVVVSEPKTMTQIITDKSLTDWNETELTTITSELVPIPKGFVASDIQGEDLVADGLVIYEGTEKVSTDVDAKTTRNQYVWVPVDRATFESNFKRGSWDNITGYRNELVPGTSGLYWEVALDETNMPISGQETIYGGFITKATADEAIAMYNSVKKYGGFYIARYEMGINAPRTSTTTILTGRDNVFSMQNKYVYNYIGWGTAMNNDQGGAVQVARSIYPVTDTNYGAVSTLLYGVQRDALLYDIVDLPNTNALESDAQKTYILNSKNMGNYKDTSIELNELNSGAKCAVYNGTGVGEYATATSAKVGGTANENMWLFTTGAMEKAKVYNIYDIGGNVYEWSMEGHTTSKHVLFGGNFRDVSNGRNASNRTKATVVTATVDNGARVTLYVK